MALRLAISTVSRAAVRRSVAAAPRPSVARAASAPCVSGSRLRSTEAEAEAPPAVYSEKISAIVDDVEKLTLVEVAELVTALKDRLNIADMPMAVAGMAMPAAGGAAEEVGCLGRSSPDLAARGGRCAPAGAQ